MATIKIALDAGHGINTAGKQTPDGINEWDLNDKVRDQVVLNLKDHDVKFVFPDNNEGKIDEGLTARRTMYVREKVAAAVSIHHNAYKGSWCTANGVEVYVDKNATAKDKELANCIYSRLVKNTGLKGRGIKKANWTVIDQDTIPAILVEGGFMDNKKDSMYIRSEEGIKAYAKAISDGLIEFLNLKKKVVKPATPSFKSTKVDPFVVKFKEEMNVRKGPGTKYEIAMSKGKKVVCKVNYKYTIVETSKVGTALWGKLKSDAGWVCIASKYCTRV
jgi:N-acetylmuramoyl-L-alanine amidase